MDIYIENLPSNVTADDLREVFELYGVVDTADLVRSRHGDEPSGLGLVGMPARSEGACAVLGVHDRTVGGQTVTAFEIQPTDPASGACYARCHCRCER
jgi:RNA recognition motif-containing protein